MDIKKALLTAIGMTVVYKAGKSAGIAEAATAINNELKENHGLTITTVLTIIGFKDEVSVNIVKVEE